MSEYEIEEIPLISEMGTPPTLGDTDNFDQDAEAYLYSQRQAFLDLNATIAVLNPVAAAIMQQAQAVASNTNSVQQQANQVSQQANEVSQNAATVNQQTQTVSDLRQQVLENSELVLQHLQAAQEAAEAAIAAAGMDPNDYYTKIAINQVLAQKAALEHGHHASSITGTLSGELLPLPTASTLGGIKVRVNGTVVYVTTDGSDA